MARKTKMIAVDEEVYDLIDHNCRKELIRHHPELLKTNISLNKIIYHACKYYVESG